MQIFKKLALVAGATIVALFCIAWSIDSFGFRNPITALLINWLGMSWIAIIGQVIHFSFPSACFETYPFERNGQIYERVGIRLFKKLVRRGPLTMLSPTLAFPKEKTVSALRSLENEMRKAESGHALIFVFIMFFVGYALINGWFDAVFWILSFNILLNGYPIMLQRYNRIKLEELVHRQDS